MDELEPPAAKRVKIDRSKTSGPLKAKKKRAKARKPADEVLFAHCVDLLGGRERFDELVEAAGPKAAAPFEHLAEVELDIVEMSSHGAWVAGEEHAVSSALRCAA